MSQRVESAIATAIGNIGLPLWALDTVRARMRVAIRAHGGEPPSNTALAVMATRIVKGAAEDLKLGRLERVAGGAP